MKSYLSKLGVLLFGVMFAVVGCQDYAEDIRKVEARLDESVSTLTTEFEEAIDALEAKLEANYATKEALESVKKALQSEIDADVKAAQDALDAAYKKADADLRTLIEGLRTDLTAVQNSKADKTALEEAKKTLNARVDAAESSIGKNSERIADVADSVKTAYNRIVTLESDVDDLVKWKANAEFQISKLETGMALKADKSALEAEIAARETADKYQSDTLKSLLEADAELQAQIDTVETNLNALKKDVENNYVTKETFDKKVVEIDDKITKIDERLTQVEKDLLAVKVNVDALLARIQSLVYAPDYLDGYATINYATITDNAGTTQATEYIPRKSVLRYKVNAKDAASAAADLVAAWAKDTVMTLSYTLESVERVTRAAVENDEELEIVNVDSEGEYLLVEVLAKNFVDDFYAQEKAYSASLRVVAAQENANDFATEYTGLVPASEAIQLGVGLTKDGVLVDDVFEEQTLSANDTTTTLDILKGIAPALTKYDDANAKWVLLTADELSEFDLEIEFDEDTTYTSKIKEADFVLAGEDKIQSLKLAKALTKNEVGETVTVENVYTCGLATATATSQVKITAEQVKAVFAEQEVEWSLALANELREGTTPYAKRIIREGVKYTKPDGSEFPYDLYTILQNTTDYTITKTVTLNGEAASSNAIQAGDWAYPAATAELRLVEYAFPEAGEDDNVYEVKWVAESESLYVEATGTFVLKAMPATVEVKDTVEVYLPKGVTTFTAKDTLVALAYAGLGAENAGFAEDAKVYDLMFAALTDAENVIQSVPNKGISLKVEDNVDNSSVSLYNSTYRQGVRTLTRTIDTWFGVDFEYAITTEPVLPGNKLIPSDDYMKDGVVNVFGKINENGVYTIDLADLGKYLEVSNEINNNLAVKFEVVEGNVTISTTAPVEVLPLTAPVKDAFGVLEADKAIVDWSNWDKTDVKIKATLVAEGAYDIDEMEFTLKTKDPLTFSYGDAEVKVTRLPGQDAVAKVYQDIVVTSIAEPSVANLADQDATSIKDLFAKSNAAHTYGIGEPVVTLYGVYSTDPRTTDANDLLPYNTQKWSFDAVNGTVTLKADDGNLLYPIYAKVNVKFTHNVHGGDCVSSSDILVIFEPSAEAREMMNKFSNGGDITLNENLVLTQPIVIDNPNAVVTLDLAGKTIQNIAKGAEVEAYALRVKQGKLIIKGEGTVDGGSGCAYNIALRVDGDAVAYIEGGHFKVGADKEGDINNCVYVSGNGQVYISGGKFESTPRLLDGAYLTLNKKDADRATTVIEVTGGEFANFNPADNVSEGPATNFVKAGYKAVLKQYSTTDYVVVAE